MDFRIYRGCLHGGYLVLATLKLVNYIVEFFPQVERASSHHVESLLVVDHTELQFVGRGALERPALSLFLLGLGTAPLGGCFRDCVQYGVVGSLCSDHWVFEYNESGLGVILCVFDAFFNTTDTH